MSAHPLFTVPRGFGLIALLPLMAAQKMGEGAWRALVLVSLLWRWALRSIAGLQPAYSAAAPERLNLRYVEKDGNAWWLADPVAQLPDACAAPGISRRRRKLSWPWRGYVAPPGGAQCPRRQPR